MSAWTSKPIEIGTKTVGVGFFCPDYLTVHRTVHACWGNKYDNGVIRRVWVDRDGRAIMIGWFFDGKKDAS